MTPILSALNVSVRFGGFQALSNVSVDVPPTGLTSVIGPNGAGKSTLFNVLSGSVVPSAGKIMLDGSDISGTPQHQFVRLGIAKSFQITSLFRSLSVFENVRIAAQSLHGTFSFWRRAESYPVYGDTAAAILERVHLMDKRHALVSSLSHGEQRSVEIAMALAAHPKLLLLDEPTAGMSPEETQKAMDLIRSLADERAVVLVEHKMKMVMGISDRIVVLHHGELLASGTPSEIRTNENVKRVYLGKSVERMAPATAQPSLDGAHA